MKFYHIMEINKELKKYGSFKCDYEPYQEIRDFRNTKNPFNGFSNPINFVRDTEGPLSDFLNANLGFVVCPKIAKFLDENYKKDVDIYHCTVENGNDTLDYYFLRSKHCLDVLDRNLSLMIKDEKYNFESAFRSVIDDSKTINSDFFDVMSSVRYIISEKLFKELKKMNLTGFAVNECDTTSSHKKK